MSEYYSGVTAAMRFVFVLSATLTTDTHDPIVAVP